MSTPGNKRSGGRRQYMVTYSRADLSLFPTRQSFGEMVEESFNAGNSAVKVSHWACCRESHEDGSQHYHCAVKLSGVKRWLSVKESIQSLHKIVVNFSDSHDYYLSAYRYVCKEDEEVEHSNNHPNLADAASPLTKRSIAANRKRSSEGSGEGSSSNKKSNRKITNSNVATFITDNNIHTYTELFAIADQRRQEGQTDISDFLFSRRENLIRELIKKAWFMQSATNKLKDDKQKRMEFIEEAYRADCVTGCLENKWFELAMEVLQFNNISPTVFSASLRDCLSLGRGKFRNVMLVGPTNCAKTFLLKPLKTIFKGSKLFENPSNDKFAWVGADKALVILLQDYRWSRESIPWKDLLLLLEGECVKLPAPKNLFAEDILINTDVAILATSKSPITYRGSYNSNDFMEDAMMQSRWKIITLHYQFEQHMQKHTPPCPKCFARLVLSL